MRRPKITADAARLTLRLVAAVPGGYAFTAAWVAAIGGLLAQAGLQRADAVVLAAMLGFLFYLVFLVWAFAARAVARVWAVLVCGTAACLWLVFMMNGRA